jgi:hypothetical protein
VRIVFSDQLERPTYWSWGNYNFIGAYGTVKHLFLIEQTGEKWDNVYLHDVLGFTETGSDSNIYDYDYIVVVQAALVKMLEEYNAERQAQGLDVLKEEDGTIVKMQP